MKLKHPHQHRPGRARGVSLLFALLALVTLSLAAVALVRSVDTSALVMGNLGFKRDATAAADQATQVAITKLNAGTIDLSADSAANAAEGYYATAHESIDATGHQQTLEGRELINWDVDGCKYAPPDAGSSPTCVVRPADELNINGNRVRYVMFRLCATTGDPDSAGNSCARPKTVTPESGGSPPTDAEAKAACEAAQAAHGEIKYGTTPLACPSTTTSTSTKPPYKGVYYRIVVRVIGARNTTSFTETIVHI